MAFTTCRSSAVPLRRDCAIVAVIPALDEEECLGAVLDRMPCWVDCVVVADNGSTDATARIAQERGAQVVHAAQRGYGAACQAALIALRERMHDRDVVVFMDADGSDDPREMSRLVDPLFCDADLVVGVRTDAIRMARHQRLGTAFVARLLGICFDVEVKDLGPYRAIRWGELVALGMRDTRFGWTAEMQARALRQGRRIREVPVSWRPGGGRSEISGSLVGSLRAGRDLTLAVLGEAAGFWWDRAVRRRRETEAPKSRASARSKRS